MIQDISKYIINDSLTVKQAMIVLNKLSDDVLTLFIVDFNKKMVGTLTDGDIRRKLIEGYELHDSVTKIMNPNFHYLSEENVSVSIIKKLRESNISLIPVLSDDQKIIRIYNLKKYKSILPIDAVMMAGGKGERLRPLTEKTPKPLLKVGDKSIIDHNVDRLLDYGISNINVTVNYLKEQIIEHFRSPHKGVSIKCISEPYFLGTIASVRFVDSFYNDYILVMNSDLFTNINYEDLFLHFIEHDADMSVVAVPYTISIPYGVFDLAGSNIRGIQEKPVLNYYANAGVYLFKKSLLDLIPDNEFFNATDFIDILIKNGYKIIRFPFSGYWIDIGKYEEYKKAQELVKHMEGK